MHHAICKSRASQPHYFRVQWKPIQYACREDDGSLKPVPVGMTREMLYCHHCTTPKCLFRSNGTAPDRSEGDGRKTAPAQARARGLAGNGQPLTPNCWNCQHLRCKLSGYVCQYEPGAEPVGKATMIRSRKVADTGCKQFVLRREMEIPPLNGDGAG